MALAPPGGERLSVHEVFAQVHELERGREVQERFGVAEQYVAARAEPIVEALDDFLPRFHVEVDENVAAEDYVDARHHQGLRGVHEVQLSEVARTAELLGNFPAVAHPMKPALTRRLRGGSERALAVHAAARGGHAGPRDVAAHDFHVPAVE